MELHGRRGLVIERAKTPLWGSSTARLLRFSGRHLIEPALNRSARWGDFFAALTVQLDGEITIWKNAFG